MKKYKKMILILLLIIIIIALLNTTIFATIDPGFYRPGTPERYEASRVLIIAGKILGILRNVGVIISVIALAIIGLKYMITSVDEKANYKENMVPYVIGCLLLMMATTIPSLIYSVLLK